MAQMQQEKHILVLGASGELGRMLRRLWQARPPAGLTAHWQYRENPTADCVKWRPGDPPPDGITRVHGILALWGVTPGPGRDLAENRRLALAAMELGQALSADRVLHCSSAAVYQPGPDPLAEHQAGGRINAYGKAKLAMEQAVADWTAAHGARPRACSMRIANVVGADSLFGAIERSPDNVTLDRFDNGESPWRSYVSVPALARVFEMLLTCPLENLPEIVNVAAPEPVSMGALARAAGCHVTWRPAPETAAPMVALDTARLAELIEMENESPEQLVAGWRNLESAS